MSEFERLNSGKNAFMSSLLQSARLDAVPEDSRARAAVAIESAASSVGNMAPVGKVASGGLATKATLVMIGAAALVTVTLAVHPWTWNRATSRSLENQSVTVATATPREVGSEIVPTTAVAASGTTSQPSVSAPDSLPFVDSRVARVPATRKIADAEKSAIPVAHPASDVPVLAAPASSSLAREIALVDEGRAAIERGDGVGALSAVRRCRSEIKNGALKPETAALEIEGLALTGRVGEARALLGEFAVANPSSPLLPRVRGFVDRASPH